MNTDKPTTGAFGDDEIDKVIGGLQNGNLYGFIGPEKTYKSTFAMAVARRTIGKKFRASSYETFNPNDHLKKEKAKNKKK